MVKNTTKIDKKLQNELSRKYLIIAAVCLITGITGVVLYAFKGTVFGEYQKWADLLIVCVLPIGIGLLMLFTVFRTKTTTKVISRVNDYEFYEDKVTVTSLKEGDAQSTVIDVPYGDIARIKKTANYIYMIHKNDIAMPVRTKGMSKEDIAEIKSYLKIK